MPAAHQADCLLRAPDLGPTEAEPQKAPCQIPLDTQREPRGPVQWADGAEAVQSERAPPRAPQHPGRLGPQGPSPRADVAEQGGWGCDARCPHWSPKHAHSARRGGWAPGQLGQGGPPPTPQTPTRCERWTPAEELAGGGRRRTVYSKDQAKGADATTLQPPTHQSSAPRVGSAPSKGTVAEQTAPGAAEPGLQTRWLPAA